MSQITSTESSDVRGTASVPSAGHAVPAAPDGGDAAIADGRSTRWADHRAARRSELVHAARKAVHRHGPDVSMEEIATTAGTSKSIVYRYFADKSGLQAAVGQAVVEQIHDALDQAARQAVTPREGLRAMVDVYLEMIEGSPNVYYFVTRPVTEDASAPIGHFLEEVSRLVAAPFARIVTGTSPAPLVADVWGAGAVGFVRGAGEWWLTHGHEPGAPTRAELASQVTAWLWTGPVGSLTRTRTDSTEPVDPPAPGDQPGRTDSPEPAHRRAADLNAEESP